MRPLRGLVSCFGGALAGALLSAGLASAEPAPRRVVSMNLCADQLAMILAAPGQLLSVSNLAQDPRSSTMAEAAKAFPANRGQAEEIFYMAPDLVLAGEFTDRVTVELLERLGLRVVRIAPAYALDDVPTLIRQIGGLLGRDEAAEARAAGFEADLAALRAESETSSRPRAALYEANGYAPGDRSLAADLLRVAGYASVSAEFGFDYGGFLPLELLIMAAPDMILAGRPEAEGIAHGEEILRHPALEALRMRVGGAMVLPDRDWICGLPSTLNAAARLAEARRLWEEKR